MKCYVYILQNSEGKTYVGMTTDMEKRIKEHNEGLSYYTKRSAGDWKVKWYCNFAEKEKATDFEKYLKTGSGIAFFRKRFL
ncbi:MAG: GIY-YIG nuclease family protein [Candidatus Margulisbacteria bacterium]|nr:GIY-YIG nuclease family protein [Candidatus Margulisiibacteriota bacterium]